MVTASVFWDVYGILFIDCLQRCRIIAIVTWPNSIDWLNEEISKKCPHMQKKWSFIRTIYHVTGWWLQWQNWTNYPLTCSHAHSILQILNTAIFICSQTWKKCSVERGLARMSRDEKTPILRLKIKRASKKVSKCFNQIFMYSSLI